MNLRRIGEHTLVAVEHERVLLDAVPKLERDLDELVSPHITLVLVHHLFEAVVRSFIFVSGRHHIPGNAATRYMIERIEETGDVKRVVVGRRHGYGEAHIWDGTNGKHLRRFMGAMS